MGFVQKLFGTHSEHELKRITPIVDKIEALHDEYDALSDEQLKAKTQEFKARLAKGETLDDILPEAFATVRAAGKRVLGMEHYRVQLIGGIILHQGRIAEMRTGEGKTLVSTLPAYLNSLTGEGVMIVTVNDYLAKRDAEWMGQLHEFLGVSVGIVLHDSTQDERRAAYACDITYVTNNELGFDYLRDNMAIYKEQLVLRGLKYAVIDEVDSVLIDEARTPLIISGKGDKSTDLYAKADKFARTLKVQRFEELDSKEDMEDYYAENDIDYVVDEKQKTATLTQNGVKKAEEFFGIENLTDPENLTIQHHVNQAIKAHGIMKLDVDYVVKDGEVIIVDEFTGRFMYGRRFNEGLHQAIEAKEGVKIQNESKTLATITFQNYFRLYKKLSGMTGTAQTEAEEFQEIYKLDVVEIPTNKPVQRIDLPDSVFKTEKGKFKNVIDQVVEAHEKGQPVLVGTISIEKSEELSKMLKKRGIKHNVLNAKQHEKEAEIVAQAGKLGAVTIATNMAGRGTDIKLDDEAKAAGGLKIIGTERHESRRIDNQLRGRAGRQGDPGESQFFISLEDDLMRLFGSERLMGVFNALGVPEGEQIQHKMLTSAIEKAQEKIEANNFGIRKNLLEYDQVDNDQREIIYSERMKVLNGDNMRDAILKMVQEQVEKSVDRCISEEIDRADWNLVELNELVLPVIPLDPITKEDIESIKNAKQLKQYLKEKAVMLYEQKETEFPEPEQFREIERVVLLRVIDRKWMDHIDDMAQLRQGIGLQAYGQKDPIVEYKMAGFDMFDDMISAIQEDTVRLLYHVQVEQKVEREQVAKISGTNKDESAQNAPKRRAAAKVYPNDPCPCGSGKKYKQCCGRVK